MAIDCNDIHTVADGLIEKFTPCYKLTADDMDTVIELIKAVELCVSAGTGFMTKSIYDINDSGVVDNSELVNSLTVETAVPAGALFTDTLGEPDLGLPASDGQVLSSTTVGVRSWVTTLPGGGDMTVAVYDTNANNIVDNAELVNSLTVESAVPSGAIFTDTVYDDTALQAIVAGKEDSLGNPAVDGYHLSSTAAGVRSWTLVGPGITNLSFTPSPTTGVITSDTGTNATITLATGTNSGFLAPADFTLLGNTSGINTGDSDTNLGYTASPTDGTVTSSDGTDATLTLADVTNAGLLAPAGFTNLGNQSGINTGDQNASEVVSTPSGNLIATDVQGALNELQTELDGKVEDAQVLTDVPAGAVFTDTLYDYAYIIQVNTNYSTANNDTDTNNILDCINPLTTITLDSTGLTTGFQQQVVNNTSGDITIDSAETVIGAGNPFTLSVGYFAFYTLISAGTWAVAVGQAGTVSPLTTKGDVYTYSTVEARLPVGTNEQILISDSAETTGLKWVDNNYKNTVVSKSASFTTALSEAGNTIYMTAGTVVTLDSTGLSVGYDQAVFNSTGGDITFSSTDTIEGDNVSLSDGEYASYTLVAATTWALAVAGPATLPDLVLNAQTGTTYSLVDADKNKLVTLDNAAAITLTVPGTLTLAIGTQIHLLNKGAGQVTVAVSSSTVNTAETLKLRKQWSMATLVQIATDVWVLTGDLELV